MVCDISLDTVLISSSTFDVLASCSQSLCDGLVFLNIPVVTHLHPRLASYHDNVSTLAAGCMVSIFIPQPYFG